MKKKIFIAGATGWAGSALSKGVFQQDNMELVGGLSSRKKGENLAKVLELDSNVEIPLYGDIGEATEKLEIDVMVEFTKPDIAKHNIITALKRKINVVIGTSGLTNEDYEEIEKVANDNNVSVLAVGNFAITVVLLQKFSEIAAKFIPNYEIIDYTHEDKIDAPSGTARELAYRLSMVQESIQHITDDEFRGIKESRGARIDGVQVHSVRLPGHVISIESIFGLKDEKLSIRHDSGASAIPYVQGGIMAIEKADSFKGLKRGLDSIMDFRI